MNEREAVTAAPVALPRAQATTAPRNLNVEPSGEVVLRLRDSTGTIRVKLGASEDGSGLLLANESTEPGVHILATRNRTQVSVKRGERTQVLAP